MIPGVFAAAAARDSGPPPGEIVLRFEGSYVPPQGESVDMKFEEEQSWASIFIAFRD